MPKKKESLPTTSLSQAKVTAADRASERRWRAESALRTCEEYAKIKGDKQLMRDVGKLAKEKINDLKRVAK